MMWTWLALLALAAISVADENCKFKETSGHIEALCFNGTGPTLPVHQVLVFEEDRPGFTLHLRRLQFTHSQVKTLQRDAFKLIPKVTQIILSNISLEVVENGAFDGIKRLKLLDLSHNNLTRLPTDVFRTAQLRHLKLDGNRMLEKPTNGPIVHAPWLEWLSLRDCDIEHLAGVAFINMPFLSHVDLSHNRLSQLPDGVFKNTSVSYMDLSHNQFKTISGSVFENIPNYPRMPRTVLLADNPWHCGCSMTRLMLWLTADLETHYPTTVVARTRLNKEAICASPKEHANVAWHHVADWHCESDGPNSN